MTFHSQHVVKDRILTLKGDKLYDVIFVSNARGLLVLIGRGFIAHGYVAEMT